MQEALAYFIVFCAAIVGVKRYAPRLAKRIHVWLHNVGARLAGRPVAPATEETAGSVQRISPDALKRTIPKK